MSNKSNDKNGSPDKMSEIAGDTDILCNDIEGVVLERLPRVHSRLNIKLSERFKSRPLPQQVEYLHQLASALNHAVDTMQRERNEIHEIAVRQEEQLLALQGQGRDNIQQLQLQTEQANIKAESRIQEIMELKAEIRKLKQNGDKH